MLRCEVHRGFCQELTFHPELTILSLKLTQPSPLGDLQRRLLFGIFGPVCLHSIAESDLMDTDLAGHMSDRPGGIDHHLGGFLSELRGIPLAFS